jgi:hypothetical protein
MEAPASMWFHKESYWYTWRLQCLCGSTNNHHGINRDSMVNVVLQTIMLVYKQTKSVSNRKTENRNNPDLLKAFLKKWWVESDFKTPSLPLSLMLK